MAYIFQDLEKFENDSARASEWNAERVFAEFQKFMSVMEQHERFEGLLPQNEKYMRKLELMRPLGMELKTRFTILLNEAKKAADFNNVYHAYVFKEMPEYPNVHQNLFNELRALQPTIFGLTEPSSRLFVRGSVYRDLNIRLKPFERKLNLVAAVASQRQIDQERERTERILKLSRYVLIVTILLLLGGVGFLVVFVSRRRARRIAREQEEKISDLESILALKSLDFIGQGISVIDRELKLVTSNAKFCELLEFPLRFGKPGTSMEEMFRFNANRGEYGEGDPEEQVRQRLELARKFEPHTFDRTRPDGLVINVMGTPISEGVGGFVTIYTDVTEKRRTEQDKREEWIKYLLEQEERIEDIAEYDLTEGH